MDKKNENNVILYQDENGITNISVRFAGDDLWLTQSRIAEIYDTTQQNVSQHIDGIFEDGELSGEATHKKFLLVQTDGKRQVSGSGHIRICYKRVFNSRIDTLNHKLFLKGVV